MKPGAQGRRDAVRACRNRIWAFANASVDFLYDPREVRAHRAMRRKLVAAMRRAVREVVRNERKAGR